MGMYGVEEDFWVAEYHFEVSFSSDNAVGLCQQDVTVGHRRKVEDLALSEFTGQQLLEAYNGPDRVRRQETFAHQVESLRASYKEARRAPHANSTRLLRHEKKDLKRLEKTLAQELSALDLSLFDLSRVQEQVQHTEHHHLLRSFYFDEVNDRYIHNFCRKYAIDPAYRADVENGVAPWVERNALFLKNLESSWWRETVGELPPNTDGVAQLQSLLKEQFFRWICRQAKKIFADPAYNGSNSLNRHLRQLAALAESILGWRWWWRPGMRFRVLSSAVPVKGPVESSAMQEKRCWCPLRMMNARMWLWH